MEKDVLRDEEMEVFNESLKLQSEYSDKKIEDDNWISKNRALEMDYEKLHSDADAHIKHHSENLQKKRAEIDALKRK